MSEIVQYTRIPIEHEDLSNMAEKTLARLDLLLRSRPLHSGQFFDKLIMLCLAQGGGLHYVDKASGLKDIDIIAFFDRLSNKSFPHRTRCVADYGPSKFGRDPNEEGFSGRRMDIMGRSINRLESEEPVVAVQRYITNASGSPAYWRKKAGVAIWPEALRGNVIWQAV